MNLKISIITINLNNANGLKKTIESVISQDFTGFELIIIDGNSIDESVKIIKKYSHKITYWLSEADRGIYEAMNKGIKQAKGDYCLFLNSGDWLTENILEKAIGQCNGQDIIYFNTLLSYGDARYEELSYPAKLTMSSFYKRTIGHQSTFIKTDLFKKYGLYNESITIHSDYEFWIKVVILENCTCKYVDMFLSYYDMGGKSSKSSELASKEITHILAKNFPERVLADYEFWQSKDKEMELYYWAKRKPVIHKTLQFIYQSAIQISKLIRKKT